MLWVIWLIFTFLFIFLAGYHWKVSTKVISHFQLSQRQFSNSASSGIRVSMKVAGTDIDEPLANFVRDFNSYLDDYNKSGRRQNRIQACGYLLASLMAISSIFLTA